MEKQITWQQRMTCSLSKRSFRTLYFTLVQSKTYCNNVNREDSQQNKVDEKSLEERLKETFETKMKNEAYSLFTDYDTYKKWLPVRDIAGYRKLYELPYYTNEKDLDMLVKKLEEPPERRRDIKYFAAPPSSGKTCSVLPAFLRSAQKKEGFTHYLYIAFDNNENRNFKASPFEPDRDLVVAFRQGAAFITKCLENILDDQEYGGSCLVDITKEDTDGKALKCMEDLVSKLSKGGTKPRILIHVDEHRKMCARTNKENDPGAEFSKGAMATLVMATKKHIDEYPVTVVATYTDAPDFPYNSTSGVCRAPVPLPPIDIERVMKETKVKDEKGNYYYPFHLPFDKKDLEDREAERIFATLKFKLAMKISKIGQQYLHVHVPGSTFPNFCKQFHEIAIRKEEGEGKDDVKKKKKKILEERKKKLRDCSNICSSKVKARITASSDELEYATALLLGIPEEEYNTITKERLENANLNLLVYGNLWTASLETLLSLRETSQDLQNVHTQCQEHMKKIVSGYDFFSSTPLEVAYRWTLACRSAMMKEIIFLDTEDPAEDQLLWTFKITCKDVEEGRIFDKDEIIPVTDDFVKENVKENILYYVKEGKGYVTHPLFNLFFLCKHDKKDTLVVIDVTGGGIFAAEEKLKKISKWIGEQTLEKYALKGIVLAPGAKMKNKLNKKNDPSVAIIGREEALDHLGGLQQVYRWFLDEEDDIALNKE